MAVSREEYERERVEIETARAQRRGLEAELTAAETRLAEAEADLGSERARRMAYFRWMYYYEGIGRRDLARPYVALIRETEARIRHLERSVAWWSGRCRTLESRIRSKREELARLEAEFKRKIPPPPIPPVQRVETNFYLIIEEKEKMYIYPRPTGRRWRRYPKGAFNARFQSDATIDPTGKVIISDEDMKLMKMSMVYELETEFEVLVDAGDITVGESNVIPAPEEIGKPPYKVSISRTVEKPVPTGYFPREDWEKTVGEYLR